MISLDDAKVYLKIDSLEEDFLIEQLIETSQALCEGILRQPSESEILKTAILYGVAYLYEHRESANHKELRETLYHLLLSERKDVF